MADTYSRVPGDFHGTGFRPRVFAVRVFLPFAAGYFLSYVFRTVDGTIANALVRDLGLSAGTLGTLTSLYFLTFAALQLPLGALIDRYGPRRVNAVLLAVAGAGAVLFGLSREVAVLMLARALIGLGTAGALMTGLKALALRMPKERLAAINGIFVMFGGMGAAAATAPAWLAMRLVGWHALFLGLGAATALVALAVYAVVPEHGAAGTAAAARGSCARALLEGVRRVYGDAAFWRLAPLSACVIGTAFAVQSLWAARWMVDVSRFGSTSVMAYLGLMGGALMLGAVLIGTIASALRRRGVAPMTIFGCAAAVFLLVQATLILRVAAPAAVVWAGFAVFAGMTVLSYAILAEMFPQELLGRANGARNVMHLGMAFAIQAAMGGIVDVWAPGADGHYPVAAYQAAFLLPFVLGSGALAWFVYARPAARGVEAAAPLPAAALFAAEEAVDYC